MTKESLDRKGRPYPYVAMAVVLVAGLVASIFLFIIAGEWEEERIEAEFDSAARERITGFRSVLEANMHALDALAAFYASSYEVERSEFGEFVKHLFSQYRGLQTVEWIPRVTHVKRDAFEEVARRDGFKDFLISERKEQGVMVRAGRRDEYFPVYYVEPYEGNERALGFDLASNHARREALLRARDTGQKTATARIRLVQEEGEHDGFLIFQPIYRRGRPTGSVEARRQNLQGFVLGVYRLHDLLKSVAPHSDDHAIDLYLFDASAPRRERFLHLHPADEDDSPAPSVRDEAALRQGMHYAETVAVGGRTWSVVCVPAPGFVPALQTWQPWGILAGGLVATGFVGSYIFLILMRVVRTREHAAEMTRAKEGLEHEIRERQRTEEALRESEEGYRISVESSNDGFAFSMEGRLLFFNRRLLEIFGYSHSSELVGKPISMMVHPDDRERVEDTYRRRMEGEAVPSRYEFRGIRKDGTPVHIEISSAVTTHRGETVNLAHLRDVTDRKRAEDAIRASEEKYRMIFEHSPIGILHFDGNGNVTSCNETLARIMGAPREKIIGFRLLESVRDPKMKAAVREPFAGRFGHYEGEYLSVTGGKLTAMKADFGPIISADGSVAGGIGIFEDITERRRLEEELRHAQKMEAIGTLTGGLAHEYNNIMTAILGYGEFLTSSLEEGSKLREYADVITASAERAARLTDGLLAYSRKQMTQMEDIDVNEVVRATERYLSGLVSEGIELRMELAEEAMTVRADKAQMEHVLINLASNAIDAMPDGGTLTMRTERVEHGSDVVKQHARIEADAYAVVTVEDTGVGIDRETQEKMFEPFFTTKEVGKGTGLGLSMVYGIIEKHGGHVSVESDAGRGAAFTLYLPLSDEREEVRAAPPPEHDAGGGETVLLAEDDGAVRNLVASVLTGAGYTVIEAVDGEDAVRKFGEHRDAVELLLFDVVMPRKNGTDAYREIREMRAGVRVVFMSGYLSDDIRIQAIRDEGNPLVWKPVKPRELLRVVRLALNGESA